MWWPDVIGGREYTGWDTVPQFHSTVIYLFGSQWGSNTRRDPYAGEAIFLGNCNHSKLKIYSTFNPCLHNSGNKIKNTISRGINVTLI